MRKAQQSCGQTGILHALGLGRRGKCGKCGGAQTAQRATFFFEPLEDTNVALAVRLGWRREQQPLVECRQLANRRGARRQRRSRLPRDGADPDRERSSCRDGLPLAFVSVERFLDHGKQLGGHQPDLRGSGASGATIAAEVALNGSVRATIVGGPLSFSGAVSGSGSLTENGNGVLVLGAGATFTGTTTIQSGATLQLGSADALPSGPNAGAVKVNGTLDLAGYSATVDGLSGHGVITSSVRGLVTLSVDTTGQSSTFSGVIEDGSGRVALTTVGTGTLTLRGTNTFTGETTVDGRQYAPAGQCRGVAQRPEVNGTLDLGGYSTTLDGLWGSGLVTSSVAGSVTLTVDTTNYPGTFSGVIEDGSGTVALTKTGTRHAWS